jgi:hypothetical protein
MLDPDQHRNQCGSTTLDHHFCIASTFGLGKIAISTVEESGLNSGIKISHDFLN